MSREMGPWGTVSRLALGMFFTGDVLIGHVRGSFDYVPWVIGLVVMPVLAFVLHVVLVRDDAPQVCATGIVGKVTHIVLFCGALAVHDVVPELAFLGDAVLLFYGTSMIVAAVRGQLDCEVLAASNWLRGRDDRVGCLIFEPFDRADRHLHPKPRA